MTDMTELMAAPHVLIVDDEPSLTEELQQFLQWHGMTVNTAGDGAQALAVLEGSPSISVVLTDIRMPRLDGLGLAGRIQRARGEADAIEVVLMTGHGSVESAAQAVRAGAFDFLRKPMVLDELLAVLQRAHAKALSRREAHAANVAEMARLRADYVQLEARLGRMDTPLGLTGNPPPELARILSHELRTPLIPLLALPDILEAPPSLSPGEFNAYLRDVHNAGERLKEIADDLIELLAPPDAQTFKWRQVSIASVLADLRARFLPMATGAGVILAVAEPGLDAVETEPAYLARSLGRLVANAIAATQPGGRIDLTAHEVAPDKVAFSVRDDGRGMTAEEIERAKRPFHQLDMSLTRARDGMGLGLPLAIRMAERLGGELEIGSAPGVGTIVSIVLPRHRMDRQGP